jgi:hypothetical protein
MLLGAFVIYFLIGQFKTSIDDQISGQADQNLGLVMLNIAVSMVNGILNSFVGVILQFIIRVLSSNEKNSSFTAINLTMGLKLVFALYCNTSVIPFFVNYSTSRWFSRSGLVMDVFFNTLSL